MQVALVVAIVVAVGLAAWPLIRSGQLLGRAGFDQLIFHERAVRIFAHDWAASERRIDLVGYLSATTPGYHLAIAAVCRFIADSQAALQVAGHVFTSLLLGTLAWVCSRRAAAAVALACVLAAAFSPYVLYPAIWLLPDNAGWFAVLLALVVAVRADGNWRAMLAAAATLVFVVAVRQVHIWTLAPVALGLLWPSGRRGLETEGAAEPASLAVRFLAVAVAATPAMALLVFFVRQWGGLTPPLFQSQYSPPAGALPVNLAALAFVLAGFGLFAPFFVMSWFAKLAELWRSSRPAVVAVAVGILVISVVPATTFDANQDFGRWNGIWKISQKLPGPIGSVGGHTSLFIVGLALVGGLSVFAALSRHRPREACIFVIAILGFAATQAVGFQLWQRYTEPFVLMMWALLVCTREPTPRLGSVGDGAREAVGPAVLALALAVFSARELRSLTPQTPLDGPQMMRELFPNAAIELTPRTEP